MFWARLYAMRSLTSAEPSGEAFACTMMRLMFTVVSRWRARALLEKSVKRRPFHSKWGSNSVLPWRKYTLTESQAVWAEAIAATNRAIVVSIN